MDKIGNWLSFEQNQYSSTCTTKTANIQSASSLSWGPKTCKVHPPCSTFFHLAKMQMSALTLNQFTTWIKDLKQITYKLHSVKSNPSLAASTRENHHPLTFAFFAYSAFSAKTQRTLKQPLLLLHLDSIWESVESLNPSCYSISKLCFTKTQQWQIELWMIPSLAELTYLKDSSLLTKTFTCSSSNHSNKHCFFHCFKNK